MENRKQKIWTNISPKAMHPEPENKEKFDRYIMTNILFDIQDNENVQSSIRKQGLHKAYEGYKSREMEFLASYSQALIQKVRTLIPNFYVKVQTSSTTKGNYSAPSLFLLLALHLGDKGPNGNLENTIRNLNDADIIETTRKTPLFKQYSAAQMGADLKFVKNNLKKEGINMQKSNLLTFPGVFNGDDLGNKVLNTMYDGKPNDAKLDLRSGLYLI